MSGFSPHPPSFRQTPTSSQDRFSASFSSAPLVGFLLSVAQGEVCCRRVFFFCFLSCAIFCNGRGLFFSLCPFPSGKDQTPNHCFSFFFFPTPRSPPPAVTLPFVTKELHVFPQDFSLCTPPFCGPRSPPLSPSLVSRPSELHSQFSPNPSLFVTPRPAPPDSVLSTRLM